MLEMILNFGRTFLRGNLTYAIAWIGLVGSVALYIENLITFEQFVFMVNANFVALGIRRAIG
jgi:hypothetical protein